MGPRPSAVQKTIAICRTLAFAPGLQTCTGLPETHFMDSVSWMSNDSPVECVLSAKDVMGRLLVE